MITLTSAPSFLNKRIISADLYAAIPPVTQSKIFVFKKLSIFLGIRKLLKNDTNYTIYKPIKTHTADA